MRTILVFLNNMSIDKIENIRQKHDPLFELIPPHITIVFPFKSDISNDELKSHILNLSRGVGKIEIEFANCITHVRNYLFLEVERGKEQITKLHDILYTAFITIFERRYSVHTACNSREKRKCGVSC